MPDSTSVTKGEFALLCNVDPTRISHWIREGRIGGDALVGSGRTARIVVAVAQAQLRRTLDPNQMTANGAGTNLGGGAAVQASAAPKVKPRPERPHPTQSPASLPNVMWQLLSEIPGQAAWHVLYTETGVRNAFHAFNTACMGIRFDLRIRAGVELPAEFFLEPDWTELAAEFGEPCDVEAWRAWSATRGDD